MPGPPPQAPWWRAALVEPGSWIASSAWPAHTAELASRSWDSLHHAGWGSRSRRPPLQCARGGHTGRRAAAAPQNDSRCSPCCLTGPGPAPLALQVGRGGGTRVESARCGARLLLSIIGRMLGLWRTESACGISRRALFPMQDPETSLWPRSVPFISNYAIRKVA